MLAFSAGCGGKTDGDAKTASLPEELAPARDAAMTAAKDTALAIEGGFADRLYNLVTYYTDDTVMTTGEYISLQGQLNAQKETAGAERIYVLVPDENGNFKVTVTTDETSWLTDKGTSSVYDEAYTDGLVAAERSGYREGINYYWTAYAPLYNSEGEIYGIVAADCTADKLADYPEWDRTSDSWNKYE